MRKTMIQRLVRPEVAKLALYQTHSEATDQYRIILDANESPYPLTEEMTQEMARRLQEMDLHRYPDSACWTLRKKIANYLEGQVSPEQIRVGNGSDELLNQLIQTFIRPGEGVLALTPTFSMYKIFTQMAGGTYYSCPLALDGTFEPISFGEMVEQVQPKLIFLCTPNNPTGTRIPTAEIIKVARNFSGLVVVDEAYGEFSEGSLISEVGQLPNLIVTRTFSKAFGLAAIRLGYLVANLPVVREISKICPPYHLNAVTQMMGEVILDYLPHVQANIGTIKAERQRVHEALEGLVQQGKGLSIQLFPSAANFLYLKGLGVESLATCLEEAGIRIRRFSPDASSTGENEMNREKDQIAIRITIGTPSENDQVIQVIQQLQERRRGNGTNF